MQMQSIRINERRDERRGEKLYFRDFFKPLSTVREWENYSPKVKKSTVISLFISYLTFLFWILLLLWIASLIGVKGLKYDKSKKKLKWMVFILYFIGCLVFVGVVFPEWSRQGVEVGHGPDLVLGQIIIMIFWPFLTPISFFVNDKYI